MRLAIKVCLVVFGLAWLTGAQQTKPPAAAAIPARPILAIGPKAPGTEKLTFGAEWRFIRAGLVTLELSPAHATLNLQSAGLVSSLFKVDDSYSVMYQEHLCATSTLMDAKEGKRHRETRVTYDRASNKATSVERDLLKNSVIRESSVEIPGCIGDVLGALMRLREMKVDLGNGVRIPVSDGRHTAQVAIDAMGKETIKTPVGTFDAVRYEAGIMNGVLYNRKGKVEVWLTDDSRKLPVQIRIRVSFPVGTVTLQLEKIELT